MRKSILLLLLFFSPVALSDGLPDLGDVSQATITPQQARQIGEQAMMQIRASKEYLDDSEVNDYLNKIGGRLVENSPEPSLDFQFFAVNDYNVNAFALPGGFVGVNAGLILITQSESELASVLSHEISHVTQHHLERMVEAQRGSGLISMAAIALAILAARTNPQVSEAAIASVQAGNIQRQLNFTRTDEEEADRIGLQLLEKSGFNTHAMPDFLRRMQTSTRLLDNNAPNYMRDHPITSAPYRGNRESGTESTLPAVTGQSGFPTGAHQTHHRAKIRPGCHRLFQLRAGTAKFRQSGRTTLRAGDIGCCATTRSRVPAARCRC